uniref:Inositol hexakisphosphate and diphosphoinositol-pentakisphosphate kinase n=1 Tax=Heliothis virescens TaxID=7102 RepID=A0A2A4KAJ1_HELVI
MSYTELEHGYQGLRQATQPQFYVGDDGNLVPIRSSGELDLCESLDPHSDGGGKKVVVGVCAMAKKSQSKPMKEILTRLDEFEYIKMLVFPEEVILKKPVEEWPICDCLISFHSKGFPLDKAIQYEKLRKPYVINNLHMQYDIQDRRKVYAILEGEGIEIPRYAVLDRDSPDPKHHELVESEDHVEVNGVVFNKPFVEKPVSAEDHNIYIYYPTSAGGGSQRLFRKIGSRSSIYSPESRVRKTGSFIYEDFMPTDGTDVKVYTVGPDYAHAEARKSPALDGKVERDSEGKEIRYPVILSNQEKLISRKVCLAFKQTVCGFDLLRANGKSFVCDVNGFSFVKNSNKYYDDCAKILGNMILRELAPTLHIPWSVPFQLDDPPIVPTTFGKMMELRCVVAVIRHGDRTPKQKMKVEVRHQRFFEIFEKYDGFKRGHVKLKKPKQLQEILDIARALLSDIQTRHADPEIEEKQGKLEQLKSVLEMYGHFSGINRKVQMKYQPRGRPRGSSSDDGNAPPAHVGGGGEPSLVLILKWGGELTPAGRIQAEELGRMFRCMYPGGQGRHIPGESGTQGLGLLRLHSTFRHDLKIYASDEGRVQMTAAAFAKGLLALEGELTPILVQMVKSANTNGLLDNDLGGGGEPSLVLILKWGGELTPAGRIQAEELGRMFRCMYPGGQGRHIPGESGTQGLGLLRLHSTFRHDLKIYASDEGRVQMTAAAFAKGLLALEGELTPILVQMVKSANTNGLLDNDCDSSKVQNMAKARLHEAMQVDREFTDEDRARINPCESVSIAAAMHFVKSPVRCCAHVHTLIQQLVRIVLNKKDDPKTKAPCAAARTCTRSYSSSCASSSTRRTIPRLKVMCRVYPCQSVSIAAAMHFVKSPVRCCAHVHTLIQQLVRIVLNKKDDPKTKAPCAAARTCTRSYSSSCASSSTRRTIPRLKVMCRVYPCQSVSIAAAMHFVKSPVRCCAHVHTLIQQLVRIVLNKKDDPKTKAPCAAARTCTRSYSSSCASSSTRRTIPRLKVMCRVYPCQSVSIAAAMHFVKSPVRCCAHVHTLIQQLVRIVLNKKDDPKTKAPCAAARTCTRSYSSSCASSSTRRTIPRLKVMCRVYPCQSVSIAAAMHFVKSPVRCCAHVHTLIQQLVRIVLNKKDDPKTKAPCAAARTCTRSYSSSCASSSTRRTIPRLKVMCRVYPCQSVSIAAAMHFVKSPVRCCAHVHTLIQQLVRIVLNKKDDPKTKAPCAAARTCTRSYSSSCASSSTRRTIPRLKVMCRVYPCQSVSIAAAMHFVKSPVRCCAHVHTLIQQLVRIVLNKKDDPKTKDTILYHGETWELMGRRWGKIEKDFCTKNKTYDISKIPDIYDCIKYDLQHNQHTLQFDLAEELYIYAKYLADIVIPQEYGLTMQEKLTIGQGICTPLLKKIRADLQRNIEESGEETVNRLNPRYSHGVSSPGRHVRTRLYFTSESHVHSLLTVLRFGGLLDVLKDEQWRRAMEYVSTVSELNYMSQIVVMLYEDPTKDPYSEERFHVELHFSPGVNCCVQKNLPPGPGFRPHSRNHSTTNNSQSSSDEVKCIEEEGEDDNMASQETLQPDADELDNTFSPKKLSKSKIRPSDPIPICNLHYTVSGHEASTLAARLNAELRARSHADTPAHDAVQDDEKEPKDVEEAPPRARSYDQHKQSHDNAAGPPPPPALTAPPPVTPAINLDGAESATNEVPLSALTFGSRTASWPALAAQCSSSRGAGRRQRHSIAGQMSYLKMLGLGARGKLSAAGLFSTAVISGSSSAPNLRVMIPSTASSNAAVEGFGGVPAIRPLETLHNALSLRQLDAFLERVTAAPVLLGTPPAPPNKPASPTNSVGWSGPSSLMSSSGELPSGLSSAGPSSPNSNYASNSEHKTTSTESNWSKNVPSKLPQWEGEAATLCALDSSLHPFMPHSNLAGSSISGDVTPVSIASELDFNSNEATAGSITDHDLLSAEGEDDEETLSVDPCGSPVKMIKNDLSPQTYTAVSSLRLDNCQPSTSKEFFGLSLQQTKECLYKDMPSSSKNYNLDNDSKQKCTKENTQYMSNIDSLNLQSKDGKSKIKKNEILNNGSRRYSDSSAQKSNVSSQATVSGSRFKMTLVTDDLLRPSTSTDSANNVASMEPGMPLVTKAKNSNVKPGFTISET